MKKYEKPMIIEEAIPAPDTALASGNSNCRYCSAYAPSIPGLKAGDKQWVGDIFYDCTPSESPMDCFDW